VSLTSVVCKKIVVKKACIVVFLRVELQFLCVKFYVYV